MMLKSLEAIEREYVEQENVVKYANIFSDIFGEVIGFVERRKHNFNETQISVVSHEVLTTFEHKLRETMNMSVVPAATVQHAIKYYISRAQGSIPDPVKPVLDQILCDATSF